MVADISHNKIDKMFGADKKWGSTSTLRSVPAFSCVTFLLVLGCVWIMKIRYAENGLLIYFLSTFSIY